VSCDQEVSVSPPDPEVPQASLFINSSPVDYDIYLNGKIQGKSTPDSVFFLAAGEYEIGLKHELYIDTTINVTIIEGESVSIDIDSYQHPLFYSNIDCISVPAGAEIFVDDTSTGLFTPSLLTNVIPGKHNITFKKPGCRSFIKDIGLVSNSTKTIYGAVEDTTIWLYYNTQNSSIPSNYVTQVEVEGKSVWAGTLDMGLAHLNNHNWEIYNVNNGGLPADNITALSVKDDNVWVGTTVGVAKIIYGQTTIYTMNNSPLPSDHITAIVAINGHEAIIGTKYSGLSQVFFDGHWENNRRENSVLLSNIILSVDRNYWYTVAAASIGLVIQRRGSTEWKRFYPDNLLMPSEYFKMARVLPDNNPDESVLFLTEEDRLCLYENLELKVKKVNYTIYDLHFTAQDIWVASDIGLLKYNRDLTLVEAYNSANTQMKANLIYSVDIDSDGKIWLATSQGLVRFHYPDYLKKKNGN